MYDIAYVAEPLNRFRQHQKTIRSVTREKVVYEEYFRLLLGQISRLDLSAIERVRFRSHVMSLWAVHIFAPTFSGILNFPYHLTRVLSLDRIALLFFVPACCMRVAELVWKVYLKMSLVLIKRVMR